MAEFGLIKSFRIDQGELDGLNQQQCFVLGYELATIDHLLTTGEPMERSVHAENRERIQESCRKAGRIFSLEWLTGDASESWLQLRVAPKQ